MEKKGLIKSAYLAFSQRQMEEAIKQYQQVFETDPTEVGALCMIGYCHAKLDQIPEALKQYRRALLLSMKQKAEQKVKVIQKKMLSIDPDSVADFEVELAALPPKPGQETTETKSLKQLLEKNPKNPELLEKAVQLFEKQQLLGDAAKYLLALGNVHYGNKQYDQAINLFQYILKIKPNYIQAHIALAETFSKQNSGSDAKKEYLYAAEQLIRNGDMERGKLFAQKAIQLKSIEAHYYLGLIYYLRNNLDEAKKEFETLLKFKVNHQGGLIFLSQLLQKSNKAAEATVYYERLLKIDPKNADILEIWAESAKNHGDSALALEKYLLAMDTFAEQEQWEPAAFCAHQAVQLDTENQELYLKLADASYNAGLDDQAAQVCLDLASVLEAHGKISEAEQMRAKAQEITGVTSGSPEQSPPVVASIVEPISEPLPSSQPLASAPLAASKGNNLQMMMNIADTYIQQGSLDEAIEVYQKIIKTDPNNEKVKSALTRVYAMFAGINPETAVARRTKNQGAEKDGHQVQREAREKAQHEAQVRSQRKTPVDSSPASKASSANDGLMHTPGHDKEDEIDGDNQDEFMTVTVAEIYTKQGLLNEALKIYQKILEIEPGNQEAKLKKQELENKMEEQEKLRQQSDKAAEAKAEAEKKIQGSKKSPDDGQDPPPPKRRGRVSYV